jgi:cytochrome c oxidase accessory protein FixG
MEAETVNVDLTSFRNHLPNVDDHNKRKWIYPKKPKGRFHRYRIYSTVLFLLVFVSIPFLRINGHPFFMLNIFERRFIIMGSIFWPQDTQFVIFLLLIFFVSIILFTTLFGRVWCGWACPQTVFMEMVFRKIEYLIEGDYHQQMKLNAGPKTNNYWFRKILKHFIFGLISVIVAHILMAYLIGTEGVFSIILQSPSQNLPGFIGLIVFSIIFYLVFTVVREVACTVICPYGRLQAVLMSKETKNIAYDPVRGEPRAKLNKKDVQTKKGDCVDCGLCQHVCPTGIDIRNGAQMECINCTACIDVCDEVMDKVKRPRGLIRYVSLKELAGQKNKIFNARNIAYSAILTVLVGIFMTLVFTRKNIETTVLRIPGQLYKKTESGDYTNMYNIQVVNKTYHPQELEFKLFHSKGSIKLIGSNDFIMEGQSKKDGLFLVQIPKEELNGYKTRVTIEIYGNHKRIERLTTSFVGPVVYN